WHGDVKPANLLITEDSSTSGVTRIDLGPARNGRLDASIRDQAVGTARYVSPEGAGLLNDKVDERSDLYAAGIVLFECLTGRTPFQGETIGEILRQHLTAQPPELSGPGLAVPRALNE